MSLRRRITAAVWAAILTMTGAAPAEPVYRLSYIPDEQDNLICFSPVDAMAILTAFHALYVAEERPRTRRLLRTLEPEMGPGRRYDCAFVRSIYVPVVPVTAIDIQETRGADWGSGRFHKRHYFIATNLLVGETKYTQTRTGGRIWVFTSDFEVIKEAPNS